MGSKQQGMNESLGLKGQEVRAAIEEWRAARKQLRQRNMPEELWEAAASLVGPHSQARVARELRLNADRLNGRVQKPRGKKRKSRRQSSFVEVALGNLRDAAEPAALAKAVEWIRPKLVLERGRNEGIRLEIFEPGHADLASILDRVLARG